MSRTLWSLVALIAALYLGFCLTLLVYQRSLIYFPQPAAIAAPVTLTLPVDDAKVLVSVRPHDGPDALIYLGGNAEDVSGNLPAFSAAFPNRELYLLNYRGFGGSSGSPSEEAIARDALALFDLVHATHPNIAVVGRSLGSGFAVRLASQRPVARLILVTPFNSLQDLAERQYPMVPVKWMLKDKFESWKYAARITIPTRLIAAENDDVVPPANTERLFARFAKGVATLQVIRGVDHDSITDSPEYLKLIGDGL